MRVCKKCGKEFDEDMNFCPYCGISVGEDADKEETPVEEMAEEQKEEVQETVMEAEEQEEELRPENLEAALAAAKAAGESKRLQEEVGAQQEPQEEEEDIPKSRLPMIIGITVIVGILIIAGVIAAIYATSKNDYTAVVENYLQGYQQKDVNKIISSHPKFMQEKITEDTAPEEIWSNLDSSFSAGLGDDWTATYTIGETTEISNSDLEALQSDLKETYDADVAISEGYWVAADLKLSGSSNSTTMPLVFAVVKIDNEWNVVYQTTRETTSGSSSDTNNAAQ